MVHVTRHQFITLLGGAAVAWPLAARAQQDDRVRRIGVLMLYPGDDPEGQVRAIAFQQGLENLGWTAGRNIQIKYLWGMGDAAWARAATAELLRAAPDVILANGGSVVRSMQQATRTVPIIFIGGADPVGDGFVESYAHPGGNLTGFTVLEESIGAKLLELLKEIAPRSSRVTVMINPDSPSHRRLFDAAAAVAKRFDADVIKAPVREAADIEAVMNELERTPGHGLIVPPDPTTNTHRKTIVALAARYRVPTIYALRAAVVDGGLISYGVDVPHLFRQAATHVDRVLRGEKPADLPVQQPTKFELVINLKTANALGLAVPNTLLVTADEVIE
jgi:putative tryptophan/tyrosine transport system substrate-binding protein